MQDTKTARKLKTNMKSPNQIIIHKATPNEIEWINEQYESINFALSNYENEFIIIAKNKNAEKMGLGRLVQIDENNIELGGIYVLPDFRGLGVAKAIVQALCLQNPYKNKIIWCLPFEPLMNFYNQFGFQTDFDVAIPNEISKKLNWCNSDNRYTQKVVLLANIFT